MDHDDEQKKPARPLLSSDVALTSPQASFQKTTITSLEYNEHDQHQQASACSTTNDDDRKMIEEMFANCAYDEETLESVMNAERDVLGSRNSNSFNDHNAEPYSAGNEASELHARQGLKDAIAFLPQKKRDSYEQATLLCPELIEIESPPERFLEAAGQNFWLAADRLCNYWTRRRDIFGPERFSLPLRLTPGVDSAVPKLTQERIAKGVMAILPPDEFGRPVFVLDRSRMRGDDARRRLQASFFMLHTIFENEAARRHGWVCVVAGENNTTDNGHDRRNSNNPDDTAISRSSSSNNNNHQSASGTSESKRLTHVPGVFELVQSETLPVKLRALHCLAYKKKSLSMAAFLEQPINFCFQYAQRLSFFKLRIRLHLVQTPQQTVNSVAEYGLDAKHLPVRFGGSVDFAAFFAQRVQRERELYDGSYGASAHSQLKPEEKQQQSHNDDFTASSIIRNTQCMKRNFDQLTEWSQQRTQKRKIQKLETEKLKLQRLQQFLAAQLTCAQTIAKQYEQDRRAVESIVLDCIVKNLDDEKKEKTTTTTDNDDDDSVESLVDQMFSKVVLFRGRNTLSRQLVFQQTGAPFPSRMQPIESALIRCLTHDVTIAAVRRRTTTQLEQRHEQSRDPSSQETESIDEQKEVDALRAQVQKLQERNTVIKDAGAFFQSALLYSEHVIDMYEEYREQNRERLGTLLSEIFSSVLKPGELRFLKGTWCDPYQVAYRLLGRIVWQQHPHQSSSSSSSESNSGTNGGGNLVLHSFDRVSMAELLTREGYILPHQFEKAAYGNQKGHNRHTLVERQSQVVAASSETVEESSSKETPPRRHQHDDKAKRQQKVHRRRRKNLKRL